MKRFYCVPVLLLMMGVSLLLGCDDVSGTAVDTQSDTGTNTEDAGDTNGQWDSETLDHIDTADDSVSSQDSDTFLDSGDTVDSSTTGDTNIAIDTMDTETADTETADTETADTGMDTTDTETETDSANPTDSDSASDSEVDNSWFTNYPPAGYEDGTCVIPQEAQLEDVSTPTTVVGDGTPESCTSAAVVNAVAQGGVITFNCGANPVFIPMEQTAKIYNNTGPRIVIDGGGKVVLSGMGERRILYMNTCDPEQVWTTDHCQNQDHPQLTLQNLTFVDADSRSETEFDGGGAVWVRGGRLKVVNSRFFQNVCADTGQDVGGGAIRAFSQYDGEPVYVVNSTFGGSDTLKNVCSNGGALSSIGVSWSIYNSYFGYNQAIGNGGNPAQPGTPGGGSGGAIYNDGNQMTLSICGTGIEHNNVVSYGSAIFFVSNDHSGNVVIDQSVITGNTGGSWYPTYPQISGHADTPITVTNSTIAP